MIRSCNDATHLSQWKFGMWKRTASAFSWFITDLLVVNVHLNIVIITVIVMTMSSFYLDSGH